MEAFVKSFAAYRTVKKATVLSHSLVLDSLDYDLSTVTVRGTAINRGDVGSWLILDGHLFRISGVKPDTDRTTITLESPLDAFRRPLELEAQPNGQTVGGFIAAQLQRHWVAGDDPVYAVPYLDVSNSDTTPFASPDLDGSGCFALPDYCRLMRKSFRTAVRFRDGGSKLICSIAYDPPQARQVSFADGRSQLQRVAYSASGAAKLTALQDVPTGEKDTAGNPIYLRERTVWYLSESGEVSQLIPDRRAVGTWDLVLVPSGKDVRTKVVETFAQNRRSHKLEFWSTLDLPVQSDCTFRVYGETLRSWISCKSKSGGDLRFYYKSGELQTTASEKLKGAKQ